MQETKHAKETYYCELHKIWECPKKEPVLLAKVVHFFLFFCCVILFCPKENLGTQENQAKEPVFPKSNKNLQMEISHVKICKKQTHKKNAGIFPSFQTPSHFSTFVGIFLEFPKSQSQSHPIQPLLPSLSFLLLLATRQIFSWGHLSQESKERESNNSRRHKVGKRMDGYLPTHNFPKRQHKMFQNSSKTLTAIWSTRAFSKCIPFISVSFL